MRTDFLSMTEQQQHLKSLVSQRESLINEGNKISSALNVNRETFQKVQGVIEYLTQIGVTLPEETEETEVEDTEDTEVE